MVLDEVREVRKSTCRLRTRISRSLMIVGKVSNDGETMVHSSWAARHSCPALLLRGMPLQPVMKLEASLQRVPILLTDNISTFYHIQEFPELLLGQNRRPSGVIECYVGIVEVHLYEKLVLNYVYKHEALAYRSHTGYSAYCLSVWQLLCPSSTTYLAVYDSQLTPFHQLPDIQTLLRIFVS